MLEKEISKEWLEGRWLELGRKNKQRPNTAQQEETTPSKVVPRKNDDRYLLDI